MCDMSDNRTSTKRIYSSSTEESDTSFSVEKEATRPDKKRQHTVTDRMSEIDIQAVLSRIEKRLDGLASKEDVLIMKEEMKKLTSTFMEKIAMIEGRLFEMETQKEKYEEEMKHLKKKNEIMNNSLRQQELKIRQIEKDNNDLEQYSRRCHLRVFRVPEKEKETADDCIRKVCSICTDSVGIEVKPCDIEVAHRTGKRSSDKPRPLLVRFFDRKVRDRVLASRRRLKGKGTSIAEDLTAANYRLLRSAADHSATMSAWSSGGRVLAKMKNGMIIRLNTHMDLDVAFNRAMSSADISVDEDDS